jgi:hypothetical protein
LVKRASTIFAGIFAEARARRTIEPEEIVSKNQAVVEEIALGHALLGVVALLGVFKQDSRLQPRAVFFADPSQFQSLLAS